GEGSISYSALAPERVAHVARVMPDAKILFLMRNPVERAWSQAVMEITLFRRRAPEAAEVLRHVEGKRSLLYADYLRTIETWRAHYPDDRIFVGFTEDIRFRPDELLERVHRFLGVET